MYRTEKLVIRLNRTERAAVEKLAMVERLPASTMARRLLLDEAEQRGLLALDSQEGRRSGEAEGEEQRAERRREDVT